MCHARCIYYNIVGIIDVYLMFLHSLLRSSWVKVGGAVYKEDDIVAVSSDQLAVF